MAPNGGHEWTYIPNDGTTLCLCKVLVLMAVVWNVVSDISMFFQFYLVW